MVISRFHKLIFAKLVICTHRSPREHFFLGCRLRACAVGVVGLCVASILLTKSEVFSAQVVDHRSDLIAVGLALVRNRTEVKLLLRGLKATIIFCNEICATISINSFLALVLAISLATHRVEGDLVVSIVEVGCFSHHEARLCQLLPLFVAQLFRDNLLEAWVFMNQSTVRLVHGADRGVHGALILDRSARDLLTKILHLLLVFVALNIVHGRRTECIFVDCIEGVWALTENPALTA